MKKRVLFVLLLLIALAVCGFSVMNNLYFGRNISIVIEEGNSPVNVVLQLKETNAIPVLNFIPSNVLSKIIGSRIKTGIYTAEKGQHFFELIIKIRHGVAEKCSITFIPGKTIYDYTKQLEANENFRGIINVEINEGEILPDTYTFFCGISKDSVFKHARQTMKEFLSNAVANVDFTTFYLQNETEVLILASIIEKETGNSAERNQVAAVFKNRLIAGMKLQTDPTVIYQESNKTGTLGRALTRDDLRKFGEYNTYTIPGLPIGPIANPSKESILAVLNPAEIDSIYFVATPDANGKHNFAKTYKDHLQNVEAYRNRGVNAL